LNSSNSQLRLVERSFFETCVPGALSPQKQRFYLISVRTCQVPPLLIPEAVSLPVREHARIEVRELRDEWRGAAEE